MKDEELVALAQKGDHGAEEELMNRYKNPVRARARSFFLNGGETEDLIQEGMMGLFTAIHKYDGEKEGRLSFKNFAYLCISSRIVDAVRSAGRGKNRPLNDSVSIFDPNVEIADEFSAEDEMIRQEDRAEFLQKIGKALSSFEFRIVVMYMEGVSYAQIAETTGKDIKSVDNALQRSKKKLMKIIR